MLLHGRGGHALVQADFASAFGQGALAPGAQAFADVVGEQLVVFGQPCGDASRKPVGGLFGGR
ncbi:hypothetical protein D3C78_1655240 [compost metagenome]